MKKKISILYLTIAVFLVGAIYLCPCSMSSSAVKVSLAASHRCCESMPHCSVRDCQSPEIKNSPLISANLPHVSSPASLIAGKPNFDSIDWFKPDQKILPVLLDWLPEIPSPDIPITFSTLLI